MGITSWAPRSQYKSVQPLPRIDRATFRMRGNHLAYAASQGIKYYTIKYYTIKVLYHQVLYY